MRPRKRCRTRRAVVYNPLQIQPRNARKFFRVRRQNHVAFRILQQSAKVCFFVFKKHILFLILGIIVVCAMTYFNPVKSSGSGISIKVDNLNLLFITEKKAKIIIINKTTPIIISIMYIPPHHLNYSKIYAYIQQNKIKEKIFSL